MRTCVLVRVRITVLTVQAMNVGIREAFKELQKRSVVLNQSQYGPVNYLLSYAACGKKIDFYYNDLAGEVRLILKY